MQNFSLFRWENALLSVRDADAYIRMREDIKSKESPVQEDMGKKFCIHNENVQ